MPESVAEAGRGGGGGERQVGHDGERDEEGD